MSTASVPEHVIGVKVGSDGQVGWLTDEMILPPGAPVPSISGAQAHPQIVFYLRHRLAGPGVTAATAMAAVGSVLGGIEVGGYLVTGPVSVPPDGLDLTLEACLLEVNGEITDSATGAAAHGHPAQALALAAAELGRRDQALEPGWLVLTGPLTAPVPGRPGLSLAAHFTHLGSVFLSA
jgi:2-oxo-3-hexenedioate decarboxylase